MQVAIVFNDTVECPITLLSLHFFGDNANFVEYNIPGWVLYYWEVDCRVESHNFTSHSCHCLFKRPVITESKGIHQTFVLIDIAYKIFVDTDILLPIPTMTPISVAAAEFDLKEKKLILSMIFKFDSLYINRALFSLRAYMTIYAHTNSCSSNFVTPLLNLDKLGTELLYKWFLSDVSQGLKTTSAYVNSIQIPRKQGRIQGYHSWARVGRGNI